MTWRDRLADWLEGAADSLRPGHEPMTPEQVTAMMREHNQLLGLVLAHSTKHIEPRITIAPTDGVE